MITIILRPHNMPHKLYVHFTDQGTITTTQSKIKTNSEHFILYFPQIVQQKLGF